MKFMNRCCFWATTGIGGSASVVGVTSAGGVAGAAILQAAGWTTGGTPILTLATVAAATAVGTSIVCGSLICCASGLMTLSGNTYRVKTNGNAAVSMGSGGIFSTAVLGAGTSALGAHILGATPVQVGYTAAAVGTGVTIFCVGFTIIGCALTCFGSVALCCKTIDSDSESDSDNEPVTSRIGSIFRDRMSFAARPARQPGRPIEFNEPVFDAKVYAIPLDSHGNTCGEAVPVYGNNQLPITVSQLNVLMRRVIEESIQPPAQPVMMT